MENNVETIKELRARTSAGVMDCKRALEESNGDLDKAEQILAEQGIASAVKKSSRETGDGVVESYIHSGGRIGVLVEINCETDFVAKNESFQDFCTEAATALNENPEADLEEKRANMVAEIGENGI